MDKMALKAKMEYTRLLTTITWLHQLPVEMRKIKHTSYDCVFNVFYNLYDQVFYGKRTGTQFKFASAKI